MDNQTKGIFIVGCAIMGFFGVAGGFEHDATISLYDISALIIVAVVILGLALVGLSYIDDTEN